MGDIPCDWVIDEWGAVLEGFTSGATPYRAVKSYYEGYIRWITSGELNYNVIYDTEEHISESAQRHTNLTLHPAGTFLMAITGMEAEGTRGSCGIIGRPSTTNQSCMAIYGTDKLDILYLYYFYLKYGDRFAKHYCQGTKQQSYTAKIVKKLPIVFPVNIKEQIAIAEVLSDIDNLITSLQKLIEKKKVIKQGTMQELLTGKKRLPGFRGEWKKVKLGDCILNQPLYGVNAPAVRYNPMFPTYIRITDITEDGKFSQCDKASVICNDYRNYLLKNNDIVLARTGASVGKSYLYNNRDGQLVYAGFLIKISINSQIANDKFVFYSLHTKKYWDWVGIVSMRSGQPGINSVEYASFEFGLPPINEQNAIAQILTDIDNELEQLERKLAKYRQIKQGMMQELLTGHIRLVDNGVNA